MGSSTMFVQFGRATGIGCDRTEPSQIVCPQTWNPRPCIVKPVAGIVAVKTSDIDNGNGRITDRASRGIACPGSFFRNSNNGLEETRELLRPHGTNCPQIE